MPIMGAIYVPRRSKSGLMATGFSAANASAIVAQREALEERLAFLTGSSGLTVEVAFVPGDNAVLVTLRERMDTALDGLGFIEGVSMAGHRALNFGRASLTATYANAWVGIGPVRAAAKAGNMPLAEALGKRTLLIQYVNGRATFSRSRSRRSTTAMCPSAAPSTSRVTEPSWG